MNRAKTLLNADEVVHLSAIDKAFPRCKVSDIQQVEKRERRACLGKQFYDALLADLVDYSAVLPFSAGTTYNEDDVVEYKGIFYQALGTTADEPSVPASWAYADKFNTESYNTLWVEYLGMYLALNVLKMTVPMMTVEITGRGMVQHQSQDFRPASDNSVKRVQYAIDAKILTVFSNMDEFLRDNANTYGLYLPNQSAENCSTNCGCSCGGTGYLDTVGGYFGGDGHYTPAETKPCGCSCASCKGSKQNQVNGYEFA